MKKIEYKKTEIEIYKLVGSIDLIKEMLYFLEPLMFIDSFETDLNSIFSEGETYETNAYNLFVEKLYKEWYSEN
jgi:hypothetical protein